MFYILLTVLAFTAFALFYKKGITTPIEGYEFNALYRVGLGLFAVLSMMIWIEDIRHATRLWYSTWHLVLPGSLFFFTCGIAISQTVARGNFGVSWTMIRMSIVIPVLVSLLFWGEVDFIESPWVACMRFVGVTQILTAVLCFGLSKSKKMSSQHSMGWGFLGASRLFDNGALGVGFSRK